MSELQHERIVHLEGECINLRAEVERLRQDSAELDRLTIQWNEARAERVAEIDDKRWGKALTAALSENERLRALSQNNATSWDAIVRERDELRAEVERLRHHHAEFVVAATVSMTDMKAEIERLRRENVELNAELTMLRMENAALRRTLDLKP